LETLRDRVAVVTGAGRGIGKAVSLSLGRLGARVALAARTVAELEAVRAEMEALGAESLVVPTDLTRDHDLERLVGETRRRWGAIDILVNNAGWGRTSPIVRASLEDWERTLRVNLWAPMVLTRLVLPELVAKGRGAVVNIGSIAGRMGQANTSAYTASKFGLVGFTECLFEEAREHGVKVAAILPGFVDTSLIPATRRLDRSKMIRPEDVAEAVCFVLVSPPTACPVEIVLRPQRTPYR
jgi:3-oxoacyl-[acyl-carrier protein] reductase